jgi:hypothetical protein
MGKDELFDWARRFLTNHEWPNLVGCYVHCAYCGHRDEIGHRDDCPVAELKRIIREIES